MENFTIVALGIIVLWLVAIAFALLVVEWLLYCQRLRVMA